MPIATPDVYAEMLRRAKENSYAFPAINCTSSESVNAALKGFADAGWTPTCARCWRSRPNV